MLYIIPYSLCSESESMTVWEICAGGGAISPLIYKGLIYARANVTAVDNGKQ